MKHFSEAALLELYYIPQEQSAPMMKHIAQCDECTMRFRKLETKLRGLTTPSPCDVVEQKPDSYWQRQRISIMRKVEHSRVERPVASPGRRVLWLAAVLCLVLIGAAIARRATIVTPESDRSPRVTLTTTALESRPPVQEPVAVATSDDILREMQAMNDPWNSDQLREYRDLVEWEEWVEDSSSTGGTS